MYSTQHDIEQAISVVQLRHITDDENQNIVQSARVAAAIADADAIIDGYLSQRYTVPVEPLAGLTELPTVLRQISVDLAVCKLYERRMIWDEPQKSRWARAIHMLERIGRGDVELIGVKLAGEAIATHGASLTNTREREWPRELLKRF